MVVHAPPDLSTARAWARFPVVVAARVYRTMLLTLTAIALVPTLFSWHAYVVKSGSMEPSIAVGDVALAMPFERGDPVAVGRVHVFDDPSTEAERVLVHRVVEKLDGGTWVTAGDANLVPDRVPVRRHHLEGRAVLLVPYVGLPVAWAQSGEWGTFALWLLLTVAAFVLAGRNLDGEPPRWTARRLLLDALREARRPEPTPAPRRRKERESTLVRARAGLRTRLRATTLAGARLGLATTLACLLAWLAVGSSGVGTAEAAFTARTRNPDSTFTGGHWLLPYVKAVMTDGPRGFYLLDEADGSSFDDRAEGLGGGRPSGSIQRGGPGALPNNPGTSVGFSGGRIVLNENAVVAPNAYTVELWFRTTSTTGGYLVGFENSTTGISSVADRTVLMTPSGQLLVGEWSGLSSATLITPRSYNDGQWHHLVVTAAPRANLRQQATVHVDGVAVASGSVTQGGTVLIPFGYWRIGQGMVDTSRWGWGRSLAFSGDIDAVAVYDKVLTAQQVAAHWAAR